jgi:magnesium chelatase family protein
VSVAVVNSRALAGMHAPLVSVEVHLANGLSAFNLVGLPETEVKESREHVRAALQNAQFGFPARRITINLAPAELPRESGRFDPPIAIGILVATGQLPGNRLHGFEFAGELALTRDLRPIRGALAMTLKASGVRLTGQSRPNTLKKLSAQLSRRLSCQSCSNSSGTSKPGARPTSEPIKKRYAR